MTTDEVKKLVAATVDRTLKEVDARAGRVVTLPMCESKQRVMSDSIAKMADQVMAVHKDVKDSQRETRELALNFQTYVAKKNGETSGVHDMEKRLAAERKVKYDKLRMTAAWIGISITCAIAIITALVWLIGKVTS
jgi:hypothetical protein